MSEQSQTLQKRVSHGGSDSGSIARHVGEEEVYFERMQVLVYGRSG